MSGLLFVTAPEADHKVINRLLVHLQDWEYGDGTADFKLVTTRSIEELNKERVNTDKAIPVQFEPTTVPVAEDLQNDWVGATIEEVEAFCVELDKAEDFKNVNTHLFVVLDTKGMEEQTCVLAERVVDYDTDPLVYPEEFNKARVPWYQVYLSWANLNIANVGWEEMMMEEDEEEVEKRWWTFNTSDEGEYLSEENKQKRDEVIRQLEQEGKA